MKSTGSCRSKDLEKEYCNFAINDPVLLEDRCQRGQWPLLEVADVYQGEDDCATFQET